MNNAEKKSVEAGEDSPTDFPAAFSPPCVWGCGRDGALEQGKGLLVIWSVECHGAAQDTGNIKIAGCSYTWNRAVTGGLHGRCTRAR